MIVVDASAIVDILIASPRSQRLLSVIRDDPLMAPELIDVEVSSALGRLERTSILTRDEADEAFRLYLELPLQRIGHRDLRADAWRLRHAVRVADAYYLACAIALDIPFLTVDERLKRSGVDVRFVPVD